MLLDEYYSFRKEMVERLKVDLLGPEHPEETLVDRPAEKYAVGILFPQMTSAFTSPGNAGGDRGSAVYGKREPDEDYNMPGEDETDPAVSMANIKYPSSMGLSFAVNPKSGEQIEVSIRCARYEKVEDLDSGNTRWVRRPINPDPVMFDTLVPRSTRVAVEDVEGLELFFRSRPEKDGRILCTVVLINTHRGGRDRDTRNELSFFQPEISLRGASPDLAPFVERGESGIWKDPEMLTNALLYRHAKDFAVGHGCSVTWTVSKSDPGRASEIITEFIPSHELLLADSNPDISTGEFSMKLMAEGRRTDVCGALHRLCDGYELWISGLREMAGDASGDLAEAARQQIELCEEALARMRNGVKLLAGDEAAWTAFRLMNQAMLVQRARTDWHKEGKPETGPDKSRKHRWRPFQIAFILLCLKGIADPESPDRTITDLLWFPTGGGKTEAYLGLIAFTIFHRRLTSPRGGGGVTAIMRYTLRLLTIQQFQRATLLICACEEVRRKAAGELDLGTDQISIGLWLGLAATPNTRQQLKDALEDLRTGVTLTRSNPKQVEECPWCGEFLHYRQDRLSGQLIIACKNENCTFCDGLPLYVVDEDLYDVKPTLVIATADKFATLPWRDVSGALFNVGSGLRPPELIIQDELHLISGPLGTLAGLYETAISDLCTVDGIGPKVIASTATIRRAMDQVRALFGTRSMKQFPPAGLDARDSYFAVEAQRDAKATRRYVGILAPSTSHATALVRTFASLLNSAENITARDEVRDHYWTLVGYFGSLRVLGGASMQVHDDVPMRLRHLSHTLGEKHRPIEHVLELTSNVPGPEIPVRLEQIAKPFSREGESPAVDVLLATNMIAVGVDVDRLGVMVVAGQTQSASEYIQATSRVGRRFPGLVVTVYNAGRSRDRSYYEWFQTFHQAMYRRVESSSVTPFSARARDRALHAVLIALVRQRIPAMAPNTAAANVAQYELEIRRIIADIVARVSVVSPEEMEGAKAQLEQILAGWKRLAREQPGLEYDKINDPAASLLINASDNRSDYYSAIPTMWSFRDVDKESVLYFVGEDD